MRQRLTGFLVVCALLPTLAASAQQYLIEAEHCVLSGGAWIAGDTASGGRTITFKGGTVRWEVCARAGTYRLFVRVRAGYHKNHTHYLQPRMGYATQVDGRSQELAMAAGTLIYFSDERNFTWLSTRRFELAQGVRHIEVSSAYGYGKCDVLILTSDLSYQPSAKPPFGPETPTDVELIPDEMQRRTFVGYTLWSQPPALNVPPDSSPDTWRDLEEITFAAAVNEYEAANFMVTNWRTEPLRLRLSLTDLESGGATVPSSRITLRCATPVQAWNNLVLADALVRLNDAGILSVPANETRQVWLTVHTQGLRAGEYRGEVVLTPVGTGDPRLRRRLPVKLTVWPFELPECPFIIFVNEYDQEHAGTREDMSRHYVNMAHVCRVPLPSSPRPSLERHDRIVREEARYFKHLQFEHWWFRTRSDWKTPEGRVR